MNDAERRARELAREWEKLSPINRTVAANDPANGPVAIRIMALSMVRIRNGEAASSTNEGGTMDRKIRTEDGVEVGEGDRVYGFHSQLTVGTIRPGSMGSEERKDEYHDRLMQGSTQPWFTVDFDNGKSELLNGQRVCSVEHARRRGWLS
jgi:hypothetical protein